VRAAAAAVRAAAAAAAEAAGDAEVAADAADLARRWGRRRSRDVQKLNASVMRFHEGRNDAAGATQLNHPPATRRSVMSQTMSPVSYKRRSGAVPVQDDKRIEAISVSEESISKRAYEKFAARGYTHGGDQDDWAVAKSELTAEASRE
jgi:hypothetical protein